jgi:F-type H+-transporting ATPase subunit gamma
MPNLKDIRRRIKSVKNTQKITQAMRMVAAAKVKRAEVQMRAARPYASALQKALDNLSLAIEQQGLSALANSRYRRLFESVLESTSVSGPKRVGLVVITSDKGLCGPFNAVLLRQVDEYLKIYQSQGIQLRVFPIGNKAIKAFQSRWSEIPVLGTLSGISPNPTPQQAKQVVDVLMKAYAQEQIDEIAVLSTQFLSMMSYRPYLKRLLPNLELDEAFGQALVKSQPNQATSLDIDQRATILVEPNLDDVLESLLPRYLEHSFYSMLLESVTSELASRMAAMASATDNAKKLMQSLTLTYNKARQAAITQELMEIVGGAEALSGK